MEGFNMNWLQNFSDPSFNATTSEGLSDEMRTYYSDYLIDNAEPYLVHTQFGQKHTIPKNGGKTVRFHKYDPLPKIKDALVEGVTPNGQALKVDTVEATVEQYGGYVGMTDMLLLTAVDDNLVVATELLGAQAGRSTDTIAREVLAAGTNVQYGDGTVSARYLLTGGQASGNDYLTVDAIRRAVRSLKMQNAEKINGSYVAIIHPDCAYDLMSDPEWKYPHQYQDASNLYEGEIGQIAGVRFVETTEAKIFHANDLTYKNRTLTVSKFDSASNTVTVKEMFSTADAAALVGRSVIIGGEKFTVASSVAFNSLNACTLVLSSSPASDIPEANDVIYPGEAGSKARDVYATLILGRNAYGVTEIAGGGLEHIVKQLGSSGTSDPLNQRATAGWKCTSAAERLVEQFMIRVETASTFEAGAN